MPFSLIPLMYVFAGVALVELYFHICRRISSGTGETVTPDTGNSDTIQNYTSGTQPDSSAAMTGKNGMLVKKWIITHTDFDGFTSGALLLRLLGKDTAILFSSPGSLLTHLTAAGAGMIDGDSIFIADLALQPQKEHDFSDCLNDFRNRGIKVIWIDHHEWPAGLIHRMTSICGELIVDTSEKTAAAVIRRMLPEDDLHADRLIRFVRNQSHDDDREWDTLWRAALTELSYRRDSEMSETLLRSWADNEPVGVLLNYCARKGLKREKATSDIAACLHRREKTARNRSLLVIDVRPRRLEHDENGRLLFVVNGQAPSLMVGQKACRLHSGDFCIILWDDFRYSVYRGLDPGLDFESLFGEHRINRTFYRVGGHKYAVSVRVEPSLRAQLKALFRWRPAPEAETFIHHLKEHF